MTSETDPNIASTGPISGPEEKPASRTRITFDLEDVLTVAEVEKFTAAAAVSGAPTLTEHFLNLTLRNPAVNPLPETSTQS